jgi:hypothetical protein
VPGGSQPIEESAASRRLAANITLIGQPEVGR